MTWAFETYGLRQKISDRTAQGVGQEEEFEFLPSSITYILSQPELEQLGQVSP
jgi:hypothetical protein